MILAIDCGSTNHKVALFDENLVRRADASTPVAYTVRDASRVEFDAEKIWQDTLMLFRQACVAAKIEPSQISTIAFASQAQTFTVLDVNGRPAMPFISWADKRAVSESDELVRLLGSEFHRHCSFPSPIPQLQLSKLLWLRRHHGDWLQPDSKIVSLPGFLAWRFGGLHVTDNNLAAMSGLYSCAEKVWWRSALEACGVLPEQLGGLVTVAQAVPVQRVCPQLELSPNVRIVFAGNDQTAGAYANGSKDGRLILTLGTALVVYRYAGEVAGPYRPSSCWGPYPGGGFYELVTRDEGCAALDWAVGKLIPNDEARFMKSAEAAAPGAALFYPQHLHTEEGWIGPDDVTARARAVIEGICFSARELIEANLEVNSGDGPIVIIGGGSKSDFWLDILANVLNRRVRRGAGDILLGAAMMARPGTKPPIHASEAVKNPDPDTAATYERVFRAWLDHAPFKRS